MPIDGPMTLDEAVEMYDPICTASGKIRTIEAGGLGLAHLCGFPDGADIDERATRICNLFGQEAFGREATWAYKRGVRRARGQHVESNTVSGVVL